MYQYKVYPSPDLPLAVVRMAGDDFLSAQVFHRGNWYSSTQAVDMFFGATSFDGTAVDERTALQIANRLTSDTSAWINDEA